MSQERITYNQLARNAAVYRGIVFKLKGKVIDVAENGSDAVLRVFLYYQTRDTDGQVLKMNEPRSVNIGKEGDDVFRGLEDRAEALVYYGNQTHQRILPEDTIVFYATSIGLISYTTVLGNSRTLPAFLLEELERISYYR